MKHIIQFLEYLEVLKKHSEHTINNYRNDLIEFLEFNNNDVLNVDREIVLKYMKYLYDKNLSRATIARKLSSLRSFYNYLYKENKVNKNYFSMIKNPKKDNRLPKLVKEIDIDKMFLVSDIRNPLGQRNLLIIRMLYATGVRVSELVNIYIKDIDMDSRTIRILGKGSKERMVVFGYNTKEILELYLNDGRNKLSNGSNDYLFLNKDGKKLSDRYVRNIINDIIFKASIEMHVSPHMLRHTFATGMLNNGADLVSVKEMLGHESLNTTSIYTHVSDDKIREIYKKAHPRA